MRTARAPWVGLVVALVLLAVAFTLPHALDWEVYSRRPESAQPLPVPPLHGYWELKWWGPGTLPALLIALLGWRYAASLAERLPWRGLLLASYLGGLGWLLSLTLVDGESGLSRVLGSRFEYLETAREADDVGLLLETFVDRIPYAAEPDNWPTHVAGHPPGALLFFVALVRLGLGGDLVAGVVVTVIAATIPLAVMLTLRALGAEQVARRVAPFLVLAPAAIFLAVSADAVFAAVGCWGMAALALAARADGAGRWRAMAAWAALSGLLFGYGVFLSYGFGVLGTVVLGVLVAARSWRPVLVLVPAALVVVAAFWGFGFAWWEAYPVLVERYWDGVAADRPLSYWWWANLAALLVATGPLLGAALAQTAVTARTASRPAVLLVAGAVLSVALASLSGMSKSEVERIWLLFVPWLLISCALLPDAWRRWGLGLQVGSALVVQHLLYTSW
jgi:methylthioxylose transferase